MNGLARQERLDWAGRVGPYVIAWGLPTLVVVAGIFTDEQNRTLLWSGALVWKGIACLLNARRCGRTHCRYTGPFYLLLIPVVISHGIGMLPLGTYGWWVLGALILFGGKLIWFATETAWGRYHGRQGD